MHDQVSLAALAQQSGLDFGGLIEDGIGLQFPMTISRESWDRFTHRVNGSSSLEEENQQRRISDDGITQQQSVPTITASTGKRSALSASQSYVVVNSGMELLMGPRKSLPLARRSKSNAAHDEQVTSEETSQQNQQSPQHQTICMEGLEAMSSHLPDNGVQADGSARRAHLNAVALVSGAVAKSADSMSTRIPSAVEPLWSVANLCHLVQCTMPADSHSEGWRSASGAVVAAADDDYDAHTAPIYLGCASTCA